MPTAGLTLYVTHSTSDPAVAADGIAAARWASQHTCVAALIVNKAQTGRYADCGADLLVESELGAVDPWLADFQFYEGLKYAIDQGVDFEQALCYRDDAMFLGRGVDDWLSRELCGESVDLVGVSDRHYHGDNFSFQAALYSRWRLPHETMERPHEAGTIHSAVFGLTRTLAQDLFHRRLLVPPEFERWPLPFGPYASWTCQMLGRKQLLKGSLDRPVAPFYVNDGWGGSYNPPPYLLHPDVRLYWSLRRVAGYSELETRAWCRSRREVST